ncbi:MAG TPA: hypothetical protein VFL90_01640 [Methylomirabilota bacterium]|nr:hypothetical protein [Methylomirabilota bacterium]
MSDEHSQALRSVIREKIAAHRLLPEPPRSVLTRAGRWQPCDGCGAPITPEERESEAEMASGQALRLHAACFVIWQDEAARHVAALIRAKVVDGTLPVPAAPPGKLWVGNGSGLPCDGCGQPITVAQIEYEPDLPGHSPALRFHQKCLELWQQQRTEYRGMGGASDVASIVHVRDDWAQPAPSR